MEENPGILEQVQASVKNIEGQVSEHAAQIQEMQQTLKDQPTKNDLKNFSTKDDIADLKNFMKNVNFGIGVFKFSFDNAGKIGALLLFLFGIGVFVKYGLIGIIAWFIAPPK